MKKGSFLNSISALVLLAFAVIWIINICVGNDMSEGVKNGIQTAYTAIFIGIFVVYIFGDKTLPKGLTWVFGLLFLCYVPSVCVTFATLFGVDLTAYPIVVTILTVTKTIFYVPFYIIIICRSCQITDSWIFRLIFIVIGLFLIFCDISSLIPSLSNALPFPMIGFAVPH